MNSLTNLLRFHLRISPRLFRLFCSTQNPSSSSPQKPLRSIIKALFREKDLNQLISNFKRCSADRNFRSKPEVYEIIIRRLATAGRLDAVDDIIEQHKCYQEEMSHEGFAVRLISLYGLAGMPERAAALFQELPALGCPRTVFSFNAVLTAYTRSNAADRIAHLHKFLSSHDASIEPNRISYNILINALCERDLLDDALNTLDLMEKREIMPDLVTFNTLLNGFYGKGMISEADEIWQRMKETGIQPDVRSFNAKIRAFAWQGKIVEAMEVLEELRRVGLEPDTLTYNALIKGYCRQGNLEEAKRLYKQMGKNGCFPDRHTLRELIPKLCQGGDVDLALNICIKAIDNGFLVDVGIIQVLIDELVKGSLHDKAKKLVKRARLKNDRANLKMPLSCLAI
ncbi:pentatricopeptide repeat-containing protein At1g55890, mitochondrial-like [Phalaenopsis equestris]|uniref:pentatricopeptide repeat-containing protein At1g55890, mitochondrial-like n=1 Tax=Phalaenopsis equestris TaxID=78828 RepID=UPI0009E554D7|nr:pentatricopeptide repeat-containing protein At1g55890, mitochondrial-like [Phalaenopsis equestris]XP_020591826.1 pentatricopeptide repeat-containing protein At1g55890, mitochondrial-like [Phalaenopsis equestris]